jgi:uncharacterized protein
MDTHTFVDDLTDDVCQTLLASHDVGRLAFLGDDGYPIVFPVNYAVDGDDIIVKTDHGEMYEHVPLHRVAFEVDQFDEAKHTGWNLLVRGEARDVTDSHGEIYAMGLRRGPTVWAPGERHHWLAIRIERISGRQIVRSTSQDSNPHEPNGATDE